MLRQAASRLLRQGLRGVSTSAARLEEAAAPAGAKEFVAQWQKSAPSTLSLPELPTNFLEEEAPADTGAEGDRFLVNFYTPNGIVAEKKVREQRPLIKSICLLVVARTLRSCDLTLYESL